MPNLVSKKKLCAKFTCDWIDIHTWALVIGAVKSINFAPAKCKLYLWRKCGKKRSSLCESWWSTRGQFMKEVSLPRVFWRQNNYFTLILWTAQFQSISHVPLPIERSMHAFSFSFFFFSLTIDISMRGDYIHHYQNHS